MVADGPIPPEPATTATDSVAAARVGHYLLVRSLDDSGDEHVDLFELRAGPMHLESFSGNRGLPEEAACNHLAQLLGRPAAVRWQPIPPEEA